MPPEILTSDELAERLKANPETIRRQTRNGSIPALRLGGEYRYEWGEVVAAIQCPPVPLTARRVLIPIIEAVALYDADAWARAASVLRRLADTVPEPSLVEALRAAQGIAEARQC